jgi:hypothetical protein
MPNISGEPERLRAPAELNETERRIFANIVAAERPGHFRASDLDLLCAYVRVIAEERRLSARIATEGDANPEGGPSPWLAALQQTRKSMLAYAHRLRISPQGRAPNNPSRPAVQLSYYERMTLEGRRDD